MIQWGIKDPRCRRTTSSVGTSSTPTVALLLDSHGACDCMRLQYFCVERSHQEGKSNHDARAGGKTLPGDCRMNQVCSSPQPRNPCKRRTTDYVCRWESYKNIIHTPGDRIHPIAGITAYTHPYYLVWDNSETAGMQHRSYHTCIALLLHVPTLPSHPQNTEYTTNAETKLHGVCSELKDMLYLPCSTKAVQLAVQTAEHTTAFSTSNRHLPDSQVPALVDNEPSNVFRRPSANVKLARHPAAPMAKDR